MKKLTIFLLLFAAALIVSCNDDDTNTTDDTSQTMGGDDGSSSDDDGGDDDASDDDDGGADDGDTSSLRYYSLAMGDRWEYDVETQDMEATRDSLSVAENTVIEGEEFSTFEASLVSNGFMTAFLANGALRETDIRLLYTGAITIPFAENEIELELPITPLFDQAAALGDELSSVTQTMVQEIEQAGMVIPLTITATVTTVQAGLEENVMVGPFTFDSVISASLNMTATITAEVSGIPIIVLQEQPVLAVNNTYAQNVGLVQSTVNFNYEFVDLTPFGIELPFPQTASLSSAQTIASFEVSADN